MSGFGVRLTPGARSWFVQVRYDGGRPRMTLGAVGTLPCEGPDWAPGARQLATVAINAARRGDDPRIAIGKVRSPTGVTLNEVWEAYAAAGYPKLRGTGRKRATTIKADVDRYTARLRPALGAIPAAFIDTRAVQRFLDTIKSEGQRSHCLVQVKALLAYATSRGLAETQKIMITPTKSRERQEFYSADELTRLDAAIVELITLQPHRLMGFAALRLLLMTGARRSEILSLRWAACDLKAAVLHLERDKTSDNRRDILLSEKAVAVLEGIPRSSSPYVFFANSAAGHTLYIEKNFRDAIARAGLRRVRIHDLRHSFASASIRSGNSLYVTGKLLGHRQPGTTARYSHLEHDVARAALDRVSRTLKQENDR